MSKDARNSLIAWGVVVTLFGSFWLDAHYHVFPDLPPPPWWWNWLVDAIIATAILWRSASGIRAMLREKAGE